MICYMLRHKFSDSFYYRPSPRMGGVMKEGTGTLYKTRWRAEMALKNTVLKDLEVVKAEIGIKAVKRKIK